jgi:hypothetical protein
MYTNARINIRALAYDYDSYELQSAKAFAAASKLNCTLTIF